jgi:hypothetical protein
MHLFKFHLHIRKLGVKFPEDCLMKMFMATLEDKARSWYEGFPSASLCSLKYFHAVFYEHFKEFCLPLPWAEKCCAYFEDFFQYLVNMYGDEENTDDEIKEALYEFSSQWKEQRIEGGCCHDFQVDFHQATISAAEDETDQIVKDQQVENSEEEGVVLEPLAHVDFPPFSVEEEWIEREQVVSDPMDDNINTVVLSMVEDQIEEQFILTNQQVKVIEHIVEHSFVDLQ